MPDNKYTRFQLSDRDLNFLVEVAALDVRDKSQLKKIVREDDEF
ncbi:hypothetical protein D3OALGA1CA_1870 [Olavius algarvensis associated proteobacterium Delta 3]|nr:hypothetical protein D3OALGA1CA_1870 [Olavius algarvensis associated proteobacterium Delta 3]CAB5135338.1 hypothetical protein D3OALGB2SA_3893 [Olavius algarvensis associated proteobacterium Delta 3]